MAGKALLFTREDSVAIITLNRPEAFNTVSRALLDWTLSCRAQGQELQQRLDPRAASQNSHPPRNCVGSRTRKHAGLILFQ